MNSMKPVRFCFFSLPNIVHTWIMKMWKQSELNYEFRKCSWSISTPIKIHILLHRLLQRTRTQIFFYRDSFFDFSAECHYEVFRLRWKIQSRSCKNRSYIFYSKSQQTRAADARSGCSFRHFRLMYMPTL